MSEERKLTRAEEERLSDFEMVEEEYKSRGYARTVLTVDIRKANLLSFAILAAAAVVYGGIFFLVIGNMSRHGIRCRVFSCMPAGFALLFSPNVTHAQKYYIARIIQICYTCTKEIQKRSPI